jgi:ADP-dependent NAD(P)H-hydrate dehydratase
MSDESPTVVTGQTLRSWPLPRPDDDGGKDARGTLVVIGGGMSTPGAILLAGLAGLRVGAGKLTMAVVRENASALAIAVPESGVIGLPSTAEGGLGESAADAAVDLLADADAVLLGPGMIGPSDAEEFVHAVMPRLGEDSTLVLDALGLTCGAFDESWGQRLGGRIVITPNAKEAHLLLDDEDTDNDQKTALRLAERYAVVAVMGAAVAVPDGRVWLTHQGNSGLGTSGSGDVLAGAVAGLAARGATPLQAAVWGLHLHASAGDRLARSMGRIGFLARELLDELPFVLEQLTPRDG